MTATINAADIAPAGTASITVVNPTPGGGTSNVIFFTVTNPVSFLTFDDAVATPVTVGTAPLSVAVGDFNGDGIQDLATANNGSNSVTILLGNGDGSFTAAAAPPGAFSGTSDIVVADYNGDGKLDLAVLNGGNNTITILLGNGDGTFSVPDVTTPTTGSNPLSMVGGDFNGDGHMDLAVANYRSNTVTILLGNGDGSFTATAATPATGVFPAAIVAGDFNNDGKLDLAVDNQCGTGSCAVGTVTILLGDGTGNFTPTQASPSTGSGPVTMAVADFNGDGNLDLAVPSDCGASGTCGTNGAVTILLGDGTGNFTVGASMPATGLRPYGVVVGDFDGDGNLDLATANNDSNTVSVLLGDGTGNFTPIASPPTTGSAPIFPAVGDFNNDGLLDIAVGNVGTDTVSVLIERGSTTGPGDISISPTSLTFDNQTQGTTSAPQTVSVANIDGVPVTFTSIVMSGDFAGATLAQCPNIPVSDTTCTFQITFTPTATGTRTGAITFTDNATGSPQTVPLTGTGTSSAGTVTLTPAGLTFTSQALNTTSAPQTVTVKNTSAATVGLTGFGTTGPFAVVAGGGSGGGACATETDLAAGASCTIGVTFTPTAAGAATGALSVSDDATGSPQMVTLTGTGASTAATVTLTPTSLTFTAQALNTTSAPQTVTVKNTGTAAVSITGFGATGPFAIPLGNTEGACGPETNLAAGASCTIGVTFTPTAAGAANGTLSVSDNATGSPQSIPLTGTGQSSAVVVITVPAGGSTTATTVPGGTAFFGLLISGAPGITGTATLGCISSSPLITCNVIPGSVVLNGGTVEVAFGVQTFCKGATSTTGFTLPGGAGARRNGHRRRRPGTPDAQPDARRSSVNIQRKPPHGNDPGNASPHHSWKRSLQRWPAQRPQRNHPCRYLHPHAHRISERQMVTLPNFLTLTVQ